MCQGVTDMPFIKIFTQKDDQKLDLKKLVKEISADMGVEPERLNIFTEAYPSGSSFRASGNDSPVIDISARAYNGQEWIQRLMTASSKAVAEQLNVSEDSINVFVHPIEDGYLLMNGKFV